MRPRHAFIIHILNKLFNKLGWVDERQRSMQNHPAGKGLKAEKDILND